MEFTIGESVATSTVTVANPAYPVFIVVGLVGVIASAVYWGLEDFYAPPSEFAERWPFNGVEKVKLGMWFFLASDVMVFGAFPRRPSSSGTTPGGCRGSR